MKAFRPALAKAAVELGVKAQQPRGDRVLRLLALGDAPDGLEAAGEALSAPGREVRLRALGHVPVRLGFALAASGVVNAAPAERAGGIEQRAKLYFKALGLAPFAVQQLALAGAEVPGLGVQLHA